MILGVLSMQMKTVSVLTCLVFARALTTTILTQDNMQLTFYFNG